MTLIFDIPFKLVLMFGNQKHIFKSDEFADDRAHYFIRNIRNTSLVASTQTFSSSLNEITKIVVARICINKASKKSIPNDSKSKISWAKAL